MNEIGFPENLPDEFKPHFVAAFNEINRLKEENNSLQRWRFSQRSERYITQEFICPTSTLFNEPEHILVNSPGDNSSAQNIDPLIPSQENKENTPKPRASRASGGKKPFPQNIPREVKIHDLPEEEKFCKFDATPLVAIGENVVEKLDVVPMTMKVIQHHYRKYACPCCQQTLVKAKTEPSMIPYSMAEPGLLAHIATNKYFFALPLYRQEALFKAKGLDIPRITLARWMIALGDAISPLVDEIKKYILSQQVIHCDETTVQVLHNTGKKSTAKNYMWVVASGLDSHPAVVFEYYPSRSKESAHEFLEGFRGVLQVDGYDGYNSFCNTNQVTRAGCWSHVRRKFESAFVDGAPAGKSLAEDFLKEIQKLFLMEREVSPFTADEQVKIRQEKSKPIIYTIRKLIDENVNKILPRSKLGAAFGYISNEWTHLIHFLNNGLIALSNNRVENSIRPFAIGRKNWLFSDTADGARASAALYSLISSAKENNLHVEEYLNDVFTKLPTLLKEQKRDLKPLLPWLWKQSPPLQQSP